jgi:IS605 OrfB family transposase
MSKQSMITTTQRTYEAKIDYEFHDLMANTYKTYNRGASAFLEFWLTFCGGVTPQNLEGKEINPKDKNVEMQDESSSGDKNFETTPDMFLFIMWFTPHRTNEVNHEFTKNFKTFPTFNGNYIVDSKDLKERFEEYLGRKTEDKFLLCLFNSLANELEIEKSEKDKKKSEKYKIHWIDRKKSFNLYGKMGYKIKSSDLSALFNSDKFPWTSDKETSQFVRGFLSSCYGEGEKTDCKTYNAVLSGFIERLELPDGLKLDKGNVDFLKYAFNTNDLANAINFKVRGRTSQFVNLFYKLLETEDQNDKKDRETERTDFKKAAIEQLRRNIVSEGMHGLFGSEMTKVLKQIMQESTGTQYNMEEYCIMLQLALERYNTFKSRFFVDLKDKYKLYEECAKSSIEFAKSLTLESSLKMHHALEAYKKTKLQEFITAYQCRGMGEFKKNIEKHYSENEVPNAKEFMEELKSIENLKSNEFFKYVAEKGLNLFSNYEDFEKFIDSYIENEFKTQRYYNKKIPPLAHIAIKNNHPRFTANTGNYKVLNSERNYDKIKPEENCNKKRKKTGNRFYIESMSLKYPDRKDFTEVDVIAYSDRLTKEIYLNDLDNTESKVVGRSSSINRNVYKSHAVNFVEESKGTKETKNDNCFSTMLFPKVRNGKTEWYFKISAKIKKLKHKQPYNHGDNILGIDLGIRNPAVGYLINTLPLDLVCDPKYYITYNFNMKDKNPDCKDEMVKVLLSNPIHLYKEIKVGNRLSSVLTENRAKIIKIEDFIFWEKLCDKYESLCEVEKVKVNEKVLNDLTENSNLNAFVKAIVKVSSKIIRFNKESLIKVFDGSFNLFHQLSEVNEAIWSTRTGGLTLGKIENIQKMKSVLSSYADKFYPEDSQKDDVYFKCQEMIDRLNTKANNMREERSRLIANMIVVKAMENDCKAIVMENLNIFSQANNNKKFNQKIANWCSRRVIEKVEHLCDEHAIKLKFVNPYNTSTLDLGSNIEKPKFRLLTLKSLDADWFKRHVEKIIKSQSESKRSMLVKEFLFQKFDLYKKRKGIEDKMRASHIIDMIKEDCKESNSNHFYFPDCNGEYYKSDLSYGEWVGSDEIAAAHIAIEGLVKLRMDLNKEGKPKSKSKAKNDKTKNKYIVSQESKKYLRDMDYCCEREEVNE